MWKLLEGLPRRDLIDLASIKKRFFMAVSTVIIGCEADFRSLQGMSREEAAKLIQDLKDYLTPATKAKATIAAGVGVSWEALNGWLRGKSKPTFQSLLKVQEFLERQPKIRGGIAPVGYVPIRGNNPNGRRGQKSWFDQAYEL